MFPPPPQPFPDGDAAIRTTDDDAAYARVSAVRKGYLQDPYIQALVPRSHLIPTRPPLINIGTFVRSEVIDRLVIKWLDLLGESEKGQIVSLGAGSDTRFWRLGDLPSKSKICKYVEIDFPEIITKKAMAIRKHALLSKSVGPSISIEKGGTVLRSEVLNLFAGDLRGEPSEVFQPIATLLSSSQPVLLISECVFPYMPMEKSSAIIRWFSEQFEQVGLISYDMFGLGDSFGRVMRDNLKTRNIELPGVQDDSTGTSLGTRFEEAGLSQANFVTLKAARTSFFSADTLERLYKLEMLDEFEELDLVLMHYGITWCWKGNRDKKTGWQLMTD